jgi:hypothetical protein
LRRLVLLVILASLLFPPAFGQGSDPEPAAPSGNPPAGGESEPPPPPPRPAWKDRMFVGGGVGLGFGDVDFVSVEPLIGVHLSPKVSVGVSLLYRWTQDGRYNPDVSTTDYGARGFAQFYPVPGFFLEAEYEYLDYEYVQSDLTTVRSSTSDVLAGAGISRPLGGKSSLYASALYNFSYDANDPTRPYDSPWVYRFGVAVGF